MRQANGKFTCSTCSRTELPSSVMFSDDECYTCSISRTSKMRDERRDRFDSGDPVMDEYDGEYF